MNKDASWEERVLSAFSGLAMALVFVSIALYLPFRVLTGGLHWLKKGYWPDFTPCSVAQIWCSPTTDFVGLNKVLYWLGAHDIGWVIVPASLGLVVVTDAWLRGYREAEDRRKLGWGKRDLD